jgi:hypothetical protein
MEGWWRSENTYLDAAMDYKERAYSGLVHVEIDGGRFRETEYKFYSPGKLAQQYARGQLADGEGLETVTTFEGQVVDAAGTVRLARSDGGDPGRGATQIQVLTPDTGVRVTANPASGVDSYRMFMFMPTPDKRYRTNFGLVSDRTGPGAANALPGARFGDLRGFQLFRDDRIAAGEVAAWQARFRERHQVRAIMQSGPDGATTLRRLDATGHR